jgi:hypothetical protein
MMYGSGLPEWVTEGTRFEDTRRFAVKLDGVEWLLMSRKEYLRETERVQENIAAFRSFVQIVENIREGRAPRHKVKTDNSYITRWLKDRIGKDSLLLLLRRLKYSANKVKVSNPYQQQQLENLAELYETIHERIK